MALFYNEEEERQANLNVINNEADDGVDLLGYASLVPSVIGKTFYDLGKLGTDVYDWAVDNEEATLDDYWTFESAILGVERSNGEKIAGEILSLMVGTFATGGAVTALAGASKLSSTNRLVKSAQWLDKLRKGEMATGKVAKLASKTSYYALEGAVADGIFTSTGQDRLSNMLSEIDGFDAMALEYLKHEEDDDAMTQRFKNFLEGAIVGTGAELAVAGVTGLFKVLRNNKDTQPLEAFNKYLEDRGLQNWQEEVITEDKVYQVTPDITEIQTSSLNQLDKRFEGAIDQLDELDKTNKSINRKNQKNVKGSIEKLEELKGRLDEMGATAKGSKKIQKEFLENLVYDPAIAKKLDDNPEKIYQILEGITGAVPKTLDNLVNSKVYPEGIQTTMEDITQAITDAYGLTKKSEKYTDFVGQALDSVASKGGLDATRAYDVSTIRNLRGAREQQFAVLQRNEASAKKLSEFADKAGKTDPSTWSEKETLEFTDTFSTMMRDMLADKRIASEFAKGLADRGHNARDLMKIAKGEGFSRAEVFEFEDMLDKALFDLKNVETPKALKGTKLGRLREAMMQIRDNPSKTAKVLDKIRRAGGDPKKIMRVLQDEAQSGSAGLFDLFMESRRANMLTGAGTHVTNAISGYGMMTYRIMQEYASAFMQAPERILRDDNTGATFMQQIRRGNAMVQAVVETHKDFAKQVWNTKSIKTAVNDLDNIAFGASEKYTNETLLNKENLQRVLGDMNINEPMVNVLSSVGSAYGKVQFELSMGAMKTLDNVVRGSMSKGVMKSEAQFLGNKHGWSIDAIEEFEEHLMKRVNNDSYRHPNATLNRELDRITAKMESTAIETTFQQDLGEGFLGRLEQLVNADNGVSKFTRAMIFPFFKTPANILLETMRTVPVLRNYSRTVNEALQSSDPVIRGQMKAKLAMSNVAYTTMAGMVIDGSITGSHRPEDRKMLQDMGIPENSIKIGDTWYSYRRLDPVGMMMGLTADVINNVEEEGAIGALIMASMNVTNKTYMQSLDNLRRAMDDPNAKIPKWALDQVRGTITPLVGVQRTINKLSEDQVNEMPKELKDFDDWMTTLTSDFVDFGQKTHKVDLFGLEIDKTVGVDRWLTGFGIDTQKQTTSNGRVEALRLGAIRDDGRKVSLGGVEMTDDELREYKRARKDLNLQGILDDIVANPDYKLLPDEARRKILENVVRDVKKGARAKFMFDVPEFSKRVSAKEQQDLMKLMDSPVQVGTELSAVRDLIRGDANRNRISRMEELEGLLD